MYLCVARWGHRATFRRRRIADHWIERLKLRQIALKRRTRVVQWPLNGFPPAERFFSVVACLVGRKLDARVDTQWLRKGRRVYLIRTIMAQTASQHEIAPRSVSFKATLQVLEAFRPVISQQAYGGVEHLRSFYEQMLRAIAQHRAADRHDRFEPRMAKRRAKNYKRLTKPRKEIKLDMIR